MNMARNGITDTEVTDAINALQAEGVAITVQSVRAKLGTGSYTTIQAALDRWRSKQTEVSNATPEMPEKVLSLSRLVWAEAWKEASKNFETEKAAFVEERQRFETLRTDMTTEINRLESELAKVTTDCQSLTERLTTSEETTQTLKLTLTKEEGQRQTLESEVSRLTQECVTLREESKTWIERASRAEGRLEEQTRKPQ